MEMIRHDDKSVQKEFALRAVIVEDEDIDKQLCRSFGLEQVSFVCSR